MNMTDYQKPLLNDNQLVSLTDIFIRHTDII